MFVRYFQDRTYWVVADVTDYSYHAVRDHRYFMLAEKASAAENLTARVQAVAWKEGSARIRDFEDLTGQQFGNGIQVMVKVMVEFHSVHGLKLVVVDVHAGFTLGRLEQQRQETIRRLLAECGQWVQKKGDRYLSHNSNLSHGAVIQRIAVVTSRSSAGYEDFRHTLERNPFGYRFQIDTYFAAVQGESNATAICERLTQICQSKIAYDAVVMMRGGGAQTDFLIFDQFELCREVARFPFPIITGIGHQKNESIVDLLAHTPTKTPTMAAEFILAHNRSFEERLIALRSDIIIRTQKLLGQHNSFLSTVQSSLSSRSQGLLSKRQEEISFLRHTVVDQAKINLFQKKTALLTACNQVIGRPQLLLERRRHELQHSGAHLQLFARRYFVSQQNYLAHYSALMRMMSPVNILKKGFALVYQEGKIITAGQALEKGARIQVRFSDSEVQTVVQTKTPIDGDEFNL